MQRDWLLTKPNCKIIFRARNNARFEMLQRFFIPLQTWTQKRKEALMTIDTKSQTGLTTPVSIDSPATTQEISQITVREHDTETTPLGDTTTWLNHLGEKDLKELGMPSHSQSIEALSSWEGLSRRQRRKAIGQNDSLAMVGDFQDMLNYFQHIEYELVGLELLGTDRAQIEYNTFDFPFEGKEALEELLLFFGFPHILKDEC